MTAPITPDTDPLKAARQDAYGNPTNAPTLGQGPTMGRGFRRPRPALGPNGQPMAPPSGQAPLGLAQAPAAPPAPPAPAAPQGGALQLAPSQGAGNLLGQTISAGPTTDRFAIAQSQYDAAQKASEPAYQASLRDALRASAAAGGLGSGQLRTSLGNLQNNRAIQADTQRTQFLNQALSDSIADEFAKIGVAQQQQGFQAGQQQTAFNQGLAGQQAALNTELGRGQLALAQTGQAQQNALNAGALTGQYGGQQTLGARQLGLSEAAQGQQFALGSRGLDIQQQGANLAQQLGLGNLGLAQNAQAIQQQQFGQQFGLSQAEAELNRQVQTGQLTLAQKNQALAELQNQQQYGLADRSQYLAERGQAQNYYLASRQTDLQDARTAADIAAQKQQILNQSNQFDYNLALARERQAADIAAQQRQLQLAGQQIQNQSNQFDWTYGLNKNQQEFGQDVARQQLALAQLQNQQQYGLADRSQYLAERGQAQQYNLGSRDLDIRDRMAADAANQFAQNYGLQLGLATGNVNGTPTLDQQRLGLQMGELTGNVNGNATLAAQAQAAQQAQFGQSLAQQLGLAKMADYRQGEQNANTLELAKSQLWGQLASTLGLRPGSLTEKATTTTKPSGSSSSGPTVTPNPNAGDIDRTIFGTEGTNTTNTQADVRTSGSPENLGLAAPAATNSGYTMTQWSPEQIARILQALGVNTGVSGADGLSLAGA